MRPSRIIELWLQRLALHTFERSAASSLVRRISTFTVSLPIISSLPVSLVSGDYLLSLGFQQFSQRWSGRRLRFFLFVEQASCAEPFHKRFSDDGTLTATLDPGCFLEGQRIGLGQEDLTLHSQTDSHNLHRRRAIYHVWQTSQTSACPIFTTGAPSDKTAKRGPTPEMKKALQRVTRHHRLVWRAVYFRLVGFRLLHMSIHMSTGSVTSTMTIRNSGRVNVILPPANFESQAHP